MFQPIPIIWAHKNPWIYIDFLTTIRSRDIDIPDFTIKPNLNAVHSAFVIVLLNA